MRVSEQDIFLSDCVREFWKEVANKAGLKNGKIRFVFFQTYFCKKKTICSLVLDLVAKKKFENLRKR